MKKTIVIGAGLSGLLAANMLRKRQVIIFEKQKTLPNNHTALLRFRTNAVALATGISLKKVNVQKQIRYNGKIYENSKLAWNNEYSMKVIGQITNRSVLSLEDCERWIAPENLIERLANGVNIKYNQNIDSHFLKENKSNDIISTMPMLNLMRMLKWEDIPKFKTIPIYTITANIVSPKVEVYQTTYRPQLSQEIYRTSITGNKVIIEFICNPGADKLDNKNYLQRICEVEYGMEDIELDNINFSEQPHGKLVPDDTGLCKKFIGWATRNHGIYSLGRWGIHRQILMDDVVKDIMFIQNMLDSDYY